MMLVARLGLLLVASLLASESRDLAIARSREVSNEVVSRDTSRIREMAQSRDTRIVRAPGFGDVTVYGPDGAPSQIVLFVSGDGGWNLGVVSMAERLRDLGALVAGIDIRRFIQSLNASKRCAYPAGALEELSKNVQLRFKLPQYKRPILVGYSSGATLVYAAIASAPPESFAGAISLGFCPDIAIHKPLCQMRGLKTTKTKVPKEVGFDVAPYPANKVPWMVLQGEIDQVCDPPGTRTFVDATGSSKLFSLPHVGHGFGVPKNWQPQFIEAYRTVTKIRPLADEDVHRASIPGVEDLSLVEVRAAVTTPDRSDTMALILTGDGGWAEIDRSIAAGLADAGIPTVGWSSLRYYWQPRTPHEASTDLARIIGHYTSAWHKSHVVVIGYSFGADVAAFLINRLPQEMRAMIPRVTLLGLSTGATFEFHVSEWVAGAEDQFPTVPEVERLPMPVTCIKGGDEDDSACVDLHGPRTSVITIGEGHHFSGDYERIVRVILAR
jgi:type IV secretory pathway VirJ component